LNAPMQGSILHMASSDVQNQRSIPRIDDGAEEVGNLNSSVRGEGRHLNVLRRLRVNERYSYNNLQKLPHSAIYIFST
jgi:hypothetical protein